MDLSMPRVGVWVIGLRYAAAKLKITRSSPRPRGMVHHEILVAGAAIGKKALSALRSRIWITLSKSGTLFVPTMLAWSVPCILRIRAVEKPSLSDATHHLLRELMARRRWIRYPRVSALERRRGSPEVRESM